DEERFSLAIGRLDALEQSEGALPEIVSLRRAAEEGRAEQERAERTAKEIAEHVSKAAGLLARQNLDEALRRVDAALALEREHKGALALRASIVKQQRVAAQAREAEERRERERQQAVAAAIAAAKQSTSHKAAIDSLSRALDLDPHNDEATQL